MLGIAMICIGLLGLAFPIILALGFGIISITDANSLMGWYSIAALVIAAPFIILFAVGIYFVIHERKRSIALT